MSRVKKVFMDVEADCELQVWCTTENLIWIQVEDYQGVHWVMLDVSTAISFSKELRKEINLAKESE